MKTSFQAKELARIASLLSSNAGKTNQVYISTSEHSTFFTTVGQYGRLSIACPAEVTQIGVAYTSMSRLEAYSMACEDGSMDLELNGDSVKVTGNGVTGFMPLMDAKEFTSPKRFGETSPKSTFDYTSFMQAIELNSFIPVPPATDFTGGFYIEATPEGIVMTTDRAQIVSRRFQADGDPIKVTVPVGFFHEILKLSNEPLQITADQATLRIKTARYIADFNLIPDHMQAIRPSLLRSIATYTGTAKLPIGPITRALNLAVDLWENRPNFYTWFDWSTQRCLLRANGERADEIHCELGGTSNQEVRIYIAHDRISRALRHFQKMDFLQDEVSFRYNGALDPMFITLAPDMEDFYAISPLARPMHESK